LWPPPATSLSIAPAGPVLVAGEPARLAVSAEPAGADLAGLVWESSAPAVAAVDGEGLVTGLADGDAVISVRAKSGAAASIALRFVRPPVGWVEVRESNGYLLAGAVGSYHFAVFPPYASRAGFAWSSGDPAVATVDPAGGLVTALAAGSAEITVSDGVHTASVFVSVRPLAPASLEGLAVPDYPAHSWTEPPERAAEPPPAALQTPRVRILTERWIELYLPDTPYAPDEVERGYRYRIDSPDDPRFAAGGPLAGGVAPSQVQRRSFPERAPFTPEPAAAARGQTASMPVPGFVVVVYRVYLKLPLGAELQRGRTYAVTADAAAVPGLAGAPLAAAYDGEAAEELIHVNQEAYPAGGARLAYLSGWLGEPGTGKDGAVDFMDHPGFVAAVADPDTGLPTGAYAPRAFELVTDAEPPVAVASYPIVRDDAPDDALYSGSEVYLLDFSAFAGSGRYRLRVPGVGLSPAFALGAGAFDYVARTMVRTLTHSRDGDHGLDAPETTRWTRPPAHLDDAVEESTGTRIDLAGGHMDAGDREKVPINMAYAASYLLAVSRLFPDKAAALGETLKIPESGNGIPDFLDEAFYELDCLYRMVANTHQEGALALYVKPATDGFEKTVGLEGLPDRVWFDVKYGRSKASTLMVAGALAMAAADPAVRAVSGPTAEFPDRPDRARLYLEAAEVAWNAYAVHELESGWWKDDAAMAGGAWRLGRHPWSSELIFACANLLEATGKVAYRDRLAAEWPDGPLDLILYGVDAGGIALADYLCVALSTDAALIASGLPDEARAWITTVADVVNAQPHGRTVFGISYQEAVNWAVGWFFSGLRTGWPNLLAWSVSGDPAYRARVAGVWNYLLGTNPASICHITGLGDPELRVRWPVLELFDYQWRAGAWLEAPPGYAVGDLQSGEFNYYFASDYNTPRMTAIDPAPSAVPLFYRHIDGWVVYNEASSFTAAVMAAIALPFFGE
jgi:hypothetical protein